MKIALNLQNCTIATRNRLMWGTWLLLDSAVILVARSLSPSPLGYGSHLQLGLPPCGLLIFSGVPCPSCGLTTSFAHLSRMQWTQGWQANPWGVFLFAGLIASLPFAAGAFLKAKPVLETLQQIHAEKIALTLCTMGLFLWTAGMLL